MPAFRRGFMVSFCVAFICSLIFCPPGLARAQSEDQALAERVLGPRWKPLLRRAGMIFVGTVLSAPPASPFTDRVTTASSSVQLRFRVDRAIAGVEDGQIVNIREWAGAVSLQRPMVEGQHVLLFLYPPGRLGFTSPVGGAFGQIALDSSGTYVVQGEMIRRNAVSRSNFLEHVPFVAPSVSVIQLERAIRGAREERP